MFSQRPPTSTTAALTNSVFEQSRIEWHQNDAEFDRNRENNRGVHQIIIEQLESPLIRPNQKQSENIQTQYSIILYAEIIDRFKLSEVQYSVRRQQCSCFGSLKSISTTEQVKSQFLQVGADIFNPNNEHHKNTVYSIHCLLSNTSRINLNQFISLTKGVEIFFQLMQFLSCVEFEKPYFQQLYADKGYQLIEIMLALGRYVFEQLKNKKINDMIKKEQSQSLQNIVRNYQVGLLLQILADMEQHDQELQFLLNKYSKCNPYQFLNYYAKNRRNNNIASY